MSSQTFQNDNINVIAEHKPGCKVSFTIKVTPAATKASREQAIKNLNKEVNIPGFRKGKAPRDLIEKNYGKFIDKEWKEVLLDTTFSEVLKLTKMIPYNQNSVKSVNVKSHSLEDGAEIHIEMETFPQVPAIDPKNLQMPNVSKKEVSDKEIDEQLHNMKLENAELVAVTDRAAKEGDVVEMDLDVLDEEEPRNVYSKTKFELGSNIPSWLRTLLIGMNAGESAEKMSEKEKEEECHECAEGHEHHHEEFKPTLCKVTLHSIFEPKYPEMNEEFFQKFKSTSEEDLRKNISNYLNQVEDQHQKQELRKRLQREILEKYPFEIPQSLINEELKTREQQILEDLKNSGVDENTIHSEIQKAEVAVRNALDHQLKMLFMIKKFAKEHNVEVTEAEATQAFFYEMWSRMQNNNPVSEEEAPSLKAKIQAEIEVAKVLDAILEQMKATSA